jgi:hypothetical protein
MGETWSMPAIAVVDRELRRPDDGLPNSGTCVFCTVRRPEPTGGQVESRPEHVLFVGSGYSQVDAEGSSIFTLDALSGDVIARADTLDRGSPSAYQNAVAANVAAYNPREFVIGTGTHSSQLGGPSDKGVTRAYVGDANGRVWKILSVRPEHPIPVADLGADQPVGVAASVLAIPFTKDVSALPANQYAHVFVASGADKRVAAGPFKILGFRDEGASTATATGPGSTDNDVTTYTPVFQVLNRDFDAGTPEGNCGYTEEGWFRGTLQAAVTYECRTRGTCDNDPGNPLEYARGRVFTGGTRLNLPNTRFAPPTPLACGSGQYPCRSQFDSILYALGAETGLPAYSFDGDASGYKIFRDSRLSALTLQQIPRLGKGGRLNKDEGQRKNPPKAPPEPAPVEVASEGTVTFAPDPTGAPPGYRVGTTVCPSEDY